MSRKTLERITSSGTDDRGLWTPSLPQAITLVLLVTMGWTAVYVSLATTNPLGVNEEVTTEFDDSVLDDDGTVVVTVVSEQNGDPVEGATVVPTSESVRLDSTPERTADEEGKVRFEFGNTGDDIGIDWSVGEQIATVTFEIDHPDEGYVDRQSNPDLTIRRSMTGWSGPTSEARKGKEFLGMGARDRSVSKERIAMHFRFLGGDRTGFGAVSFQ
ncbi:hypothetical protein [Halorhabdus rudnickae]|uniref:hypothetical protein n=1 Tax=Halorhabdus rudnickae TaxID=1775544 RepID=UPI001083FF2F|nr:hypothetical protein [Halorhabdus rudnickae]